MILHTCIACECLERLIDSSTRKPVAAYGWIDEGQGLPRKYWVSIENDTVQFFREESLAKYFYEASIEPMKASVCQIKRNGNHKKGQAIGQAASK